MNYKLRIYKISGIDKGNLDHEEFFQTRGGMENRYKELFKKELYSYNPTAWIKIFNYNGYTVGWERLSGF